MEPEPEPEVLGDEPVRLGHPLGHPLGHTLGQTLGRRPRDVRDDESDVLEAGPGEPWRPRRWMLVTVVLALLGGGVATYADQRSRADEARALDVCRRELHDAAISSDLQMMAVATTVRPTPPATRDGRQPGVAGVMSRSARLLLPDVVDADEVCRAVSVRPWHFSLKARRDAATAYSTALAAKLRAVAADGRTHYLDDRSLSGLRRAADVGVFDGRY